MSVVRDLDPVPPPEPPLTDGVITLRPWRMEDAPAANAAVQDPEIPRFMDITPDQALDVTERWLGTTPGGWQTGTAANFAIVAADGDQLLGSISLSRSCDDHEVGEIGYWVVVTQRGRGVASRAVALLTDWGFSDFGLERIEITAHETNPGSLAVAEHNGFRREGVLRGYRRHRDLDRVNLWMLARVKGD